MKDKAIIICLFFYFLLAGIIVGYTNFLLCLVVLLCGLMLSNKNTSAFYLLAFGASVGGIVRNMYPSLPVYGLMLNFIGIFLLKDRLLKFYRDKNQSMLFLLLCFAIFGISFLLGPQTEYSKDKMIKIVMHGSLMFYAYYLYDKSDTINVVNLCFLLLMTSLLMIVFAIERYGFNSVSLLDYTWLRFDFEQYMRTNERTLIFYQDIGMNALMGVTFFFSQAKYNIKHAIFISIIAIELILLSGAKQAILGFVVVLVLRLGIINNEYSSKKIVYFFLAMALAFILYEAIILLNLDYITTVIESGDQSRMISFIEAYNMFLKEPLTGVGLGGYPLYSFSKAPYPHNIILEILSECGLIGIVSITSLVYFHMSKCQISINHLTANNSYYFLIIIALFVRVLVSSDLSESIEIISALFAVSIIEHHSKRVLS